VDYSSYPPQNKGSILLEVMLALAIVSLSLVSLIHSFARLAEADVRMSRYTTAIYLFSQKQAQLDDMGQIRPEAGGVFDPPFENFSWQARQRLESDLVKTTLAVSWKESGEERHVAATFLARREKSNANR